MLNGFYASFKIILIINRSESWQTSTQQLEKMQRTQHKMTMVTMVFLVINSIRARMAVFELILKLLLIKIVAMNEKCQMM